MPAQLEFYFAFLSPYSYMASTRRPRLTAEHGIIILYQFEEHDEQCRNIQPAYLDWQVPMRHGPLRSSRPVPLFPQLSLLELSPRDRCSVQTIRGN
jgi:hypothetical protein